MRDEGGARCKATFRPNEVPTSPFELTPCTSRRLRDHSSGTAAVVEVLVRGVHDALDAVVLDDVALDNLDDATL